MAGIYIHIPFCKQACSYCNFHFSTSLGQKDRLVQALLKEIRLTKSFFQTKHIDTIYFGGGTPSILSVDEIGKILDELSRFYSWKDDAEITLEANPDDLILQKIQGLYSIGINRLSIGIQSFFDEDLKYMNRSHNAEQAFQCIDDAHNTGFSDLSIDLIFGSPSSNPRRWAKNLDIFSKFEIPHISCYGLTVEPKTVLENHIRTGRSPQVSEEQQVEEFELTMDYLETKGYEHYEISNYALSKKYARHNTAYWKGSPYLGIGPSAHSFDGASRFWNIANNALYISSIAQGKTNQQIENLSAGEKYNETIMTSLRTQWGIAHETIESLDPKLKEHFLRNIINPLQSGTVLKTDSSYILTRKGKMIADRVCSELFFVD